MDGNNRRDEWEKKWKVQSRGKESITMSDLVQHAHFMWENNLSEKNPGYEKFGSPDFWSHQV